MALCQSSPEPLIKEASGLLFYFNTALSSEFSAVFPLLKKGAGAIQGKGDIASLPIGPALLGASATFIHPSWLPLYLFFGHHPCAS